MTSVVFSLLPKRQHFKCHRKREVCSFFSEEERGSRNMEALEHWSNKMVSLFFAPCFWRSISLHESSFQIPGSRNDLFVVGHLRCLIHFFCNFFVERKQSKMPTSHPVSFLDLILLHLHMATRVCSKPMLFPAWCGTQVVHCFGSLNAGLLPQVQQEMSVCSWLRCKCN